MHHVSIKHIQRFLSSTLHRCSQITDNTAQFPPGQCSHSFRRVCQTEVQTKAETQKLSHALNLTTGNLWNSWKIYCISSELSLGAFWWHGRGCTYWNILKLSNRLVKVSTFRIYCTTSLLGPKTLQRKIQHGASSEGQKMSCPVMTNRGWDIIQSGTCLWSWVLNVPRKTSPHTFMKADDWRKESRRCAPIAIRYFWFDSDVFRTSNLCSSRTATLWSWCQSCHAQQLFRLAYISLIQLYTELSNCTIVTTTAVILTWCWRSAITHFQLNTWLQVKSWQVPRERSRLFHSVVSKPSYIVEHGHHFFHTCTRNSSPLVRSLEQRHHPSFASALVSQDVGPYFTTLVHTATRPSVSILVRDQSSIITDLQNHQSSQYSRAWDSLLPWSHEGLDFPVSTSVLWQNLKSQALMQVR